MSIGRASVMIGAGTLVSRVTGLLRSVVLVTAVGTAMAGDAFVVANQLPNAIFLIVSMGILTGVIVPQIVAAGRSEDGGEAFISKLITLGSVVLLGITVIAVACAPLLVSLYGGGFSPQQHALATVFAYWCLPQIFFYGLYALLGETLNARRVFGPYTWTPVINNVVSIIGFGTFILIYGTYAGVEGWDAAMIALIAGTATLGIVVQAILLLFFWRRTGLHLRPDFRWRGMGLGVIGRLASWTFLMVLVGQLSAIVQSNVLSDASDAGAAANMVTGNANLIFMLPYSIIVLSIGIPYFTQISEHAADGRIDDMRRDIDTSIRSIGVLIVGATAALAAAAVPVSRIFTNDAATAVEGALVLGGYLVGLIPIAVLFTIQRSFYALGDTRTPFLFSLAQAIIVAVTAVLAATLPVGLTAAGVALGQSVALTVALVIAAVLLRRRLGRIGAGHWLPALGRFILAALPAGGAGWALFMMFGAQDSWMVADKLQGALGTMLIGAVVAAVYVGILALLRAPELQVALGLVRRVLPGKR
ncbi:MULTISPECIES: murein biosynthesis integral membrane protein MurJ [unclassified Microbacterium]|uniref:murein biosynthesis integral membrane protein MurJ n=1 Tax=unclassified Microbacterium TaxID=2609290 RepID=UPI00214B980D|nr:MULTISPECIES: murein biosynthesis integral membrane protein MurJ [unclassified Microbacterium]MCR2783072.1 murein biosynthesis integral membrane protein MurJ [Microbacterium sp. zg.B96]MDL5352143.1 murein biosynthesis integral membrane protein MurJ [Microbacterium sp. zg-YB36]WIM16043.1 murein biosynthesis integral membrane protein MurJ [Microbacterium sp. zg-B96]